MLPSPATTFWSDSAALSEVFLPLLALGAGDELHHAEATRVVEGDARARGHVEHDVVVGGVLRALVIVAAGRGLAAPRRHAKRTRHAEMHHQHVAGGKVGEQIFGAPA